MRKGTRDDDDHNGDDYDNERKHDKVLIVLSEREQRSFHFQGCMRAKASFRVLIFVIIK
jgi:hypothetical protein